MARTRIPEQDLSTDAPQTTAPVNLSGLSSGNNAQNQLGNSAVAQQSGVNGRTDISQYTPQYVEAHRDELGIPAGAPVEDFFNEFVAHKLAYQDLSSWNNVAPGDPQYAAIQAQRQMLESWGYNSNITAANEVMDPNTGLYAVRLDPNEQGLAQGRGSKVAFRGTEPFKGSESSVNNPWGAINDVTADLGTSVGSSQYNANADRIRGLMAGGVGDITTTGHSLGGYLAERAAVENNDLMGNGNVVTFQAGGLNREDANRFDAANADGHIGVRHHYTDMDVVHRAGEQRLGGTFFEHQANALTEGHTKYLMYNDNDVTTLAEATGGKNVVQSNQDTVSDWSRHLYEGGRTGLGGVVRAGMAPINAAWQTGVGLGNGIVNAASGLGTAAMDTYNGVAGGLGTAWNGAASGASQMWNGDLLGGLGTMGSGLLSGTGEALSGVGQGLWGLGKTGVGAITDTAGALWNGASTLVGDVGQGVYQAGRGALNLVEGAVGGTVEAGKYLGGKALEAGSAAWEGAKSGASWLGDQAVSAGSAVADGAAWAGNKVLDAGAAVGSGLKSAWDTVTSW